MTALQHKRVSDFKRTTGFSNLIGALATSCKIISHAVAVAPVQGLTGTASGAANTSGDVVKKLDLLSNTALIHFLKNCGEVHLHQWTMVS